MASRSSFGDAMESEVKGLTLSIPTVIASSLLFQFPTVFMMKTTSETFSIITQGPVQYMDNFDPFVFSSVGVKTHTLDPVS